MSRLQEIGAGVALCLYRITQEALHNVAKHSGAGRTTVMLSSRGHEVFLTIADDGVGFDPVSVRQKGTLGLASMRERARLVRGQLTVSSKPGYGTKIRGPPADHGI